jgi:peptide/nickel transport system substrate-binding protein
MRTQPHRLVITKFALPAAVLTLGTLLAACGNTGSKAASSPGTTADSSASSPATTAIASSDSSGSTVVNWAYTNDEPSWDPVVVGATSATQLLSTIYEPLFTLNAAGQLEPALATGYTYNSTGTAVTITLRPGLTFQDGSPLNAQAVAFNVNRIETQTNSALKADWGEVASTTVLSPTQIRLNLKQADYQIPYVLANRSSLLASEQAATTNLNGLNTNDPIGAGPFKVVKFVPGSEVSLVKWDGYWDAKDIHVDKVNIFLNVDPATVLSGLQTGVYNFVTNLPNQDVALAKSDGLKVVTDTARGWGAYFLSLNVNKAPFNNPLVVKAFQYAVNRQQFVSETTFGLGTASVQPFPPSSPAYNPSLESSWPYPYNPALAKQALAQAGYKPGQLSVDIDAISGAFNADVELLQQQLSAVGIKSNIVLQTVAQFYTGYYGKTDSLALYGYVGRDSKLEALDEHFSPSGILNLSAPDISPQYAAAREQVLGLAIDSPGYETALQAATKAGVLNGSTITLLTEPQAYATTKGFSEFPVVDGSFRWNGVTINGQ